MAAIWRLRQKIRSVLAPYFLYCVTFYSASLPVSMAGMEIFGWVAFFLYVTLYFDKEDLIVLRKWRGPAVLFGLFIAHIGFSAILNGRGNPEATIRIFGECRFILMFALWLCVFSRFQGNLIGNAIKALVVFAAMGSIYAILQTYTGFKFPNHLPESRIFDVGGQVLYRGSGFFKTPLTFAHSYGLIAVFILALWINNWKFAMRGVVPSWAAQVLGILHSFTRGVWVALAITSGSLIFTKGRRAFLRFAGALAVLVFIGGLFSPVFRARVSSIVDLQSEGVKTRLNLWRANLHLAIESPYFGVGYGENHTHLKDAYKELGIDQTFVSHAHNNILELLGGTGFLGAAILLAAYGWIVGNLLKYRHPLAVASGAVVLQLFLSGFVEANFFDGEVNHIFHFLLAIGASLFPGDGQPKFTLLVSEHARSS